MRTLGIVLALCFGAIAQDSLPSAYLDSPLVREREYALWHNPGAVETLDFRYGIGGAEMQPKPPFKFSEEDYTGTTAKVKVKDANGRSWVVKFGKEASPDTFCTRVAWAMGYYVTPSYFIEEGVIEGAKDLQRAKKEIDAQGRFRAGRFQLRSADPKFLKYVNWSWTDNPFLGTPELSGLKITMMLLSDWDNKDAQDAEKRGTNTAIYQHGDLYYYFIDDWGGAMGKWGKYLTRNKWDAGKFLEQSSGFLEVADGELKWGYVGQHSSLLKEGVKPADIQWLMQYLSRVTDDQLRAGLRASGADEKETETYVKGLRMRIGQLQKVAALNTASNQ